MNARGSLTADLVAIYDSLDEMHASRGWHWWPDVDPFEAIVGAILVQNTSWTNVEHALDLLRSAGALSPVVMASLPTEALEPLVRPSGQYRQKTKKLQAFLALVARHGDLDQLLALEPGPLRDELLATWGIGAETADAIIVYAACKPAFVVDAYTQRIFSRLGLGPASTAYDDWQRFFAGQLPVDRDFWARYHALIVMHAKHLCLKSRPKCTECALLSRCPGSPLVGGAA